MKSLESNRSRDVRGVEPLENRQLFAGFAADGPGYFPGLRPFAHHVDFNPAVAMEIAIASAIESGHFSFVGPDPTQMPADATPNSPFIASPTAASDASSNTNNVGTGPRGGTNPSTSARTLVATDDASTRSGPSQVAIAGDNTGPAGSVAALALSDASPAALPGTTGPVNRTGAPAAPVMLSLNGPKIFADRPVTAAIIVQTAAKQSPGNGLPSYLKAPAAYEMTAYQAPAARGRAGQAAPAADEPAIVAGVKLGKGPQHVILAAVPTGDVFSQPLWQRIAAVSATVVLLAVNWMLRRKREKARHARAT